MKKLFFLITFIILGINYSFANEIYYKTIKDTFYSKGDSKYSEPINKSELLYWQYNKSVSINYNSFDNILDFTILLNRFDNKEIWINGLDLELSNSLKIFNSSYYYIIPIYYLEMLQKNNPKIRKEQKEIQEFNKYYKPDLGEESENGFFPERFIISDTFIYFTPKNFYLVKQIECEKDFYKISIVRREKDIWGDIIPFYYEQPYPKTYMNHKNEYELTLIIKFDGDYLDIWINNINEYLGKYFIATRKTLEEIVKLVIKGSYNNSNVYWPRHADGSSDFDKEIKLPMVQLIDTHNTQNISEVTTSSATTVAVTNVSPNKTMSVTENLKLRSGEATSTQVLTVMSAGTKVKILELGKAETIDGINSNWVKVEVQRGAKDRDGKEIKTGTVGWCYSGYLR